MLIRFSALKEYRNKFITICLHLNHIKLVLRSSSRKKVTNCGSLLFFSFNPKPARTGRMLIKMSPANGIPMYSIVDFGQSCILSNLPPFTAG